MLSAENGKNEKSFIAVDEFGFLQSGICDFKPPEAVPTEPPTTPEPTEPPGRKKNKRLIYFIWKVLFDRIYV